MDRVALQYFIAVVEHRNMTRAAVALHVTQPALSKAIKALEAELGVRLLDRDSRGVTPTEAGLAVHARALEILDGFDSLARDARRTRTAVRERIRIGFTATLSSVPTAEMIARLLSEHPDLDVTAWGIDSSDYAAQTVERGECDVAVMGSLGAPVVGTGLRAELLCHDPLVVLAHVNSPFTRLERVGLEHLHRERFIGEPRGSLLRDVLEGLRRHGLRIGIDLVTRQALVQLVSAAAGAALVPRRFALQHEVDGLVIRELDPPMTVGLWIITREVMADPVREFHRIAQAVAAE
jgi:DNA-binding transcriptional LysR family regulator